MILSNVLKGENCKNNLIFAQLNKTKYKQLNNKQKDCIIQYKNSNYKVEYLPIKENKIELKKINWFHHFSLGQVYEYDYNITDEKYILNIEKSERELKEKERNFFCKNEKTKEAMERNITFLESFEIKEYDYKTSIYFNKEICKLH